jgi:ribose 5-phosphate isomerase A
MTGRAGDGMLADMNSPAPDPKQRAAAAALDYIRSETIIGLGTGSTADAFLIALAGALGSGKLHGVRGVCTSEQTRRRASELAIPIIGLDEVDELDVAVDGADEVGPNLDLIKGMGGALLREKMVAQAARQFIVIADASKRVDVLGTRSALPVEVVPFAHRAHEPFLQSLGASPALRTTPAAKPYVTDNGNFIYDCHFRRIADPSALAAALAARAGVVETGLFIGIASLALIGDNTRVTTLRASRA